MKESTTKAIPASVDSRPTRQGEVRARWAWTEASVWTERMLTALELGVKGGTWFSLIDKVWSSSSLRAAWLQVRRNKGAPGIDGQTVERFEAQWEQQLLQLQRELQAGSYRPRPVRRVWIDKPGSRDKRPLGIPTVRDRIVQAAIVQVIEPIFEKDFVDASFGYRPGRSAHGAIAVVDQALARGQTWVVDADIKSYFDTIPHARLLEKVKEKLSDGRILGLLESFLKQSVRDGEELVAVEQGTPQGGVLSPLLANLYLHGLDLTLKQRGFTAVRYADDLLLLCTTEEQAQEGLEVLREQLQGLGLSLHPEKTRIVEATRPGGFDFLGYRFERGRKRPSDKSLKKMRARVREVTPRRSGKSLEEVIRRVNRVLRGWWNYFRLSTFHSLKTMDSVVRRRLRRLLDLRHKRRSRPGPGFSHLRWPNAFFVSQGLFCMATALREMSQAPQRAP